MLNDLAALAPSLLVCAAFLIAVGWFLRHEMAGRAQRRAARDDAAIAQDRDGQSAGEDQGEQLAR